MQFPVITELMTLGIAFLGDEPVPKSGSRKIRYYRATSDPNTQFWALNLLGWFGISLVTYLSLSLPYDQFELGYLGHNVAQSTLGLFLSLPMRYVFRAIWNWSFFWRVLVGVTTVLALSASWAVLRLLLFMVMTGERELWGDFGGWLFPSIFVFLAWAALYHGVKYHQLLQREHENLLALESQQRQEALKRAQAESEVRDAQLKLLRYQLNPHFLFNTLNSVTALINVSRAADAQKMLLRLSNFLRYSLESDDKITVPLKEEIDAASLYLQIERARFFDRLTVEILAAPHLMEVMVPSLFLQPLLENAIKYAISQSETGGTIRVEVREEQAGMLQILVEDSGPGKQAAELVSIPERTGIGLANTRARLENLYGEDFSLRLEESPLGGVRITATLPMYGALTHAV